MAGYYGVSDVGYGRNINEDRIDFLKLGEDTLCMAVLDGEGSKKKDNFQPSAIIFNEIKLFLNEIYLNNLNIFKENIEYILRLSILNANRVLGAMKLGVNAEEFGGMAASVTLAIVYEDKLYFAHCGNTRLYLLRSNKDNIVTMKQITRDQTKAQKLIDEGLLSQDDYMFNPDKSICFSGVGIVADPKIQTFSLKLKKEDIILMSTDGLHYAVRPEPIREIILKSGDCMNAAKSLVEAAKSTKHIDNVGVIVYAHN